MDARQAEEMESLCERVIGHAIEVHRELGPGLLEAVYRDCLLWELKDANIEVASDCRVPIVYKGRRISTRLVIDLLIEERLIVECKAIERVHPVHLAQVITYLKLTGYPVGLLMNFNTTSLRSGLRRLTRPDLYVKKAPPTIRHGTGQEDVRSLLSPNHLPAGALAKPTR